MPADPTYLPAVLDPTSGEVIVLTDPATPCTFDGAAEVARATAAHLGGVWCPWVAEDRPDRYYLHPLDD